MNYLISMANYLNNTIFNIEPAMLGRMVIGSTCILEEFVLLL